MQQSFSACLAFLQQEEGGLSTNASDGGCYVSGRAWDGPLIGSKCGISAATLAAWLKPDSITPELMRDLPQDSIEAIVTASYWLPTQGDALPAGLDLMVLDHAFNAGIGTSGRLLQRCLGVTQDGWIGNETLAAIPAVEQHKLLDQLDADSVHGLQQALCITTDGVIGPQTQKAIAGCDAAATLLLITALTAKHAAFYRACADVKIFGAGWLARVQRRQMAAYKLVFASPTISAQGASA